MLIIDPPVTPFSPPREIQAWINTLDTWLEEETDKDHLEQIRDEKKRAERYLKQAEELRA